MFPVRICRSGIWKQWNKVNQRKKSTLPNFNHVPGVVDLHINKPQLDVSHRNMHLPHALVAPMPENLPEVKEVESIMMSVFPEVVSKIKTTLEYREVPEIMDRLIEVIEKNVPYGRRHRGISILYGYELLMEQERQKPTRQELEKIARCSWCVEMAHWFILALDDIIDDSAERRKRPTWFKVPGIGLPAINDAVMVAMYAEELCKIYFEKHPNYLKLRDMFHRVLYLSSLGQGLDMITKDILNNRVKFEMFNMEKYRYLVKYKTTDYSFQLNLEFPLVLVNKYDPKKIKQVQPIMDELGYFFQIHNDCKDLYRSQGELISNENLSMGTDIPYGKLTWLVVRALEDGSSRQKKIIYDHYGKENQESIEKVLKVYDELELLKEVIEYEEKSFKWICEKTLEVNNVIPHNFFHYLISTTYRRDPRLIWENSKLN